MTHLDIDAYTPAEVARAVETLALRKAQLPLVASVTLGVLAGVFIALGGALFTLVMTDHGLGFGPARLLGGVAFSLGLVLVVIGGAELFTGNNLMVMAWAEGKLRVGRLLASWTEVYLANLAGALGAVALVHMSGILELADGHVGDTAAGIAAAKIELGWREALIRGVLCNALVCLAVWLAMAAHTVAGKVIAIIFPVTAFVALGFEHSVANMYLIPVGMLASGQAIDLLAFASNLLPVTLGNILGGSGFVALTYWLVYLRKPTTA